MSTDNTNPSPTAAKTPAVDDCNAALRAAPAVNHMPPYPAPLEEVRAMFRGEFDYYGKVEPVDMILHCPACGLQHVDAPEPKEMFDTGNGTQYDLAPDLDEWTNPPHRSHLCHGCGHIWRPADVPTNGVAEIKTVGKASSPKVAVVEPSKAMLKEAIDDKVARAEDLMKDFPPHRAAQRYNEATEALNDVIDRLFSASKVEQVSDDKRDAERLMFAMQDIDGFGSLKMDKHDYAMQCMEERGRNEPTAVDELDGVRRLIDAAIATTLSQPINHTGDAK